jgi:DNA repair ATPase RecN
MTPDKPDLERLIAWLNETAKEAAEVTPGYGTGFVIDENDAAWLKHAAAALETVTDLLEKAEHKDLERMIDALDHIMRVARQGITPTRRLDWIAQRARYALERKEWSEDIAEEPRDSVAELHRKSKKLRDERTELRERAERAEQAAEEMRTNLSALVSDVLSFKQYNITSRNDYTPGLRNAIAALAGKEGKA